MNNLRLKLMRNISAEERMKQKKQKKKKTTAYTEKVRKRRR